MINLNPEIRIYNNPETITYEASIKTNAFKDYYITMSNIRWIGLYNIKFQKKPFMFWIWISVIMISFGGIFKLIKKIIERLIMKFNFFRIIFFRNSSYNFDFFS